METVTPTPVESIRNSRNKMNNSDLEMIEEPKKTENSDNRRIRCSVCHLPIQGLFVTCEKCHHVSHVSHFREWFDENEQCRVAVIILIQMMRCGCVCYGISMCCWCNSWC